MRNVCLTVLVAHRSAADAFAAIADFASYPKHSAAVRSVVVTESETDQRSTWEVAFRNGLLRWTELDTLSPATGTITFQQVEGDVDQFEGGWEVRPTADGGASVRFSARIDMGMPTLADVLEPIASRTLLDNTLAIIHGMFGPTVQLVDQSDTVPDSVDSLTLSP